MDNEYSELERLHKEFEKHLEEDARKVLEKKVLEEDPVLCKQVSKKKVAEEDPIDKTLLFEMDNEDSQFEQLAMKCEKFFEEDSILCKEVLEKKVLKEDPILCKKVLEEDPVDKSLYERVVYCRCSEIETFSHVQLSDQTYAFATPSNEPILFVAVCGKLKSMKDVDKFIWFEVEDETGVVLCRTELPEKGDDIDGTEEYGKFAVEYKKMLADKEKSKTTMEEMMVVLSMKRGTWRAKQKYSALQRRDFDRWCGDDEEKNVIVHGKIATLKGNVFLFAKKVWMAKPVEVKVFRQMLIAKENQKIYDERTILDAGKGD